MLWTQAHLQPVFIGLPAALNRCAHHRGVQLGTYNADPLELAIVPEGAKGFPFFRGGLKDETFWRTRFRLKLEVEIFHPLSFRHLLESRYSSTFARLERASTSTNLSWISQRCHTCTMNCSFIAVAQLVHTPVPASYKKDIPPLSRETCKFKTTMPNNIVSQQFELP